jgi:hypothetical protein
MRNGIAVEAKLTHKRALCRKSHLRPAGTASPARLDGAARGRGCRQVRLMAPALSLRSDGLGGDVRDGDDDRRCGPLGRGYCGELSAAFPTNLRSSAGAETARGSTVPVPVQGLLLFSATPAFSVRVLRFGAGHRVEVNVAAGREFAASIGGRMRRVCGVA